MLQGSDCDDSSAITASIDCRILGSRIAFTLKVLGGIVEVIKAVLAFQTLSLFVPFFTIVAASTQTDLHIHALEVFHPDLAAFAET